MCRFKFCFTLTFLALLNFYVDNCLACVSLTFISIVFAFFFWSHVLYKNEQKRKKYILKNISKSIYVENLI